MAISTQGIKLIAQDLYIDVENPSVDVDIFIKSFPDLGAAPTAIEVTTLSDDVQKFIPGIKGMAAMEFVANYDETTFNNLSINENQSVDYVMYFSESLQYTFTGSHNVVIVGGGLNAAVDMKVVIIPSSKIEKVVA